MKNLLVMRHAKSDWGNSSLSDFDRPLNDRGLRSAPIMGKELLKRNKVPELIISSPALRAKTTAELTAQTCGYKQEIAFEKEFYFGSLETIIEKIIHQGKQFQSIMIVGHNPTSESLLYRLLKEQRHQQMPTASIASVLFQIDDWTELKPKSGELEWLIIPKEFM